eukprot:5408787-Amphidinium_carterae.1
MAPYSQNLACHYKAFLGHMLESSCQEIGMKLLSHVMSDLGRNSGNRETDVLRQLMSIWAGSDATCCQCWDPWRRPPDCQPVEMPGLLQPAPLFEAAFAIVSTCLTGGGVFALGYAHSGVEPTAPHRGIL